MFMVVCAPVGDAAAAAAAALCLFLGKASPH